MLSNCIKLDKIIKDETISAQNAHFINNFLYYKHIFYTKDFNNLKIDDAFNFLI